MSDLPSAIHPDILPRLDPEYVAIHNAQIAHRVPLHTIPWHPDIRKAPHVPGGSPVRTVGAVKDISLQNCKIRAFIPEGTPPQEGWPVLLFIHGGGWTLGDIDTSNSFISRQCKENNCVSVAVDYRLAPENPYPAAVEDTIDALKFIYYSGKAEFNANVNKIAVGGSSRCLQSACLKAQELNASNPHHLPAINLIDNTASVTDERYPSWKECQNTVLLSEGRMMWFRNMYLPDPATWTEPDNSPIFASDALLAKVPPAYIGVCEVDILQDEGIAYGEKLKSLGVKVEVKIYPRAPHSILGMDAALKVGRQLADDSVKAVGDAFKAA
ncbi:Alpha/Beta hydrolase protein [Suillus subalutaceus]|uniref:Alpha/Beta hydrolase protein n=1 Tax=Suillus subalutaceus TaxID=48586 RepID=UPI001B8828DA|nr:Alpha/Beta hydrolase protein [Suillus subalutaceus]KAG1861801.1 Alpha/Beta hydrolase protein [Suillus subalutaceus]